MQYFDPSEPLDDLTVGFIRPITEAIREFTIFNAEEAGKPVPGFEEMQETLVTTLASMVQFNPATKLDVADANEWALGLVMHPDAREWWDFEEAVFGGPSSDTRWDEGRDFEPSPDPDWMNP